jgi:hypothetical protein
MIGKIISMKNHIIMTIRENQNMTGKIMIGKTMVITRLLKIINSRRIIIKINIEKMHAEDVVSALCF